MKKAYWVPENFLFQSAGDCLDARPDDGAAALVVCHTYAERLEKQLAVAKDALLNIECGSAVLSSVLAQSALATIAELEKP